MSTPSEGILREAVEAGTVEDITPPDAEPAPEGEPTEPDVEDGAAPEDDDGETDVTPSEEGTPI